MILSFKSIMKVILLCFFISLELDSLSSPLYYLENSGNDIP